MFYNIFDTLREYRVPHGLSDPNPCSTAALQYIICLLVWGSWASSGLDTVDSVDTRLVTLQQSRYVASHCRVIKLYTDTGA